MRGTALLLLLQLIVFTGAISARAMAIHTGGELPFCAIRFDCCCGTGEVNVCRKLLENGVLIICAVWLPAIRADAQLPLQHGAEFLLCVAFDLWPNGSFPLIVASRVSLDGDVSSCG